MWHTIEDQLQKFLKRVRANPEKEPVYDDKMDDVISNGFQLISLSEQVDEMTGMLTFGLFWVHLMLSTAGIFVGSGIVDVFTNDNVSGRNSPYFGLQVQAKIHILYIHKHNSILLM
jgi:hypothetical protein